MFSRWTIERTHSVLKSVCCAILLFIAPPSKNKIKIGVYNFAFIGNIRHLQFWLPKNKPQSPKAKSRAIYRKTQAQFHIGYMPNHTYCMHTNWSLQKTPNYQWKKVMWQTQTPLQLQIILWSNDSFARCLSVLIFYNLAKETLFFSSWKAMRKRKTTTKAHQINTM